MRNNCGLDEKTALLLILMVTSAQLQGYADNASKFGVF
jgi:hypothetical protein